MISFTLFPWIAFVNSLYILQAAWEMSFLISSECSLTEPYVAHILPEILDYESAVFLGNSMPIRDADMYGSNKAQNTHGALMLNLGLPCHWIQVVGNRGASGIDGLLSTAVGFAVGCNKRVSVHVCICNIKYLS